MAKWPYLVLSEEWRPVDGYAGRYEVSNLGRVRSLPNQRRKTTIILKQQPNVRTGYFYVNLTSHNGRRWVQKNIAVAVMVAIAFKGPRPPGMEACHNDGNHQNNRERNLRWDTPESNQADRVAHGTANIGSANPRAVLDEEKVRAIKLRLKGGEHPKDIAADYSVAHTTIKAIKNDENWRHIHV